MNPDLQQPQPEQSQPQVHNPLAAMQDGEQMICEIKRHPIGIMLTYLSVGVFLVILAVIFLVLLPDISGGNRSSVATLGIALFLILAVLGLGFVFIANTVYWGNRWIVTSDSITQITQTGLFHKQSGQLSMENVEDISATQNGILAHMFNFGTLKAETANEKTKFLLTFCPRPVEYAQKLIDTHEKYILQTRKHEQGL